MMMRHLVAATTAILAVLAIEGAAHARETSGPLMAITRADMERATVVGTGCTWTSDVGQRLFAATDDIAVVRISTGMVRLRPHKAAKDMFPFTFDRWAGHGVEVKVSETGRTHVVGTELMRTPAVLSVTMAGRKSRMSGMLNCGS